MSGPPVSWRDYILKTVKKERYKDGTWCWIWQDKQMNGGTPMIRGEQGERRRARRVAYEEFVGPIPDDIYRRVVVRCGNRLCLSPDHMLAVTYAEERRLRQDWKGTDVELQVDIRADRTVYVYALTPQWEQRMRQVRGAEDLGNGEFLLPPWSFRFVGLKAHETKTQWVRDTRARLGEAEAGYDPKTLRKRGWQGLKAEEEAALGTEEDLDIG